MSEIKLLPCPFCGGEAMLDREYIFCDECHLIMRIDDILYSNEAETYEEARNQAIEQWNTRKPMERIIGKLEDKKWGTSEWRDKWRDEIIGECIEVVKEEGGIE